MTPNEWIDAYRKAFARSLELGEELLRSLDLPETPLRADWNDEDQAVYDTLNRLRACQKEVFRKENDDDDPWRAAV